MCVCYKLLVSLQTSCTHCYNHAAVGSCCDAVASLQKLCAKLVACNAACFAFRQLMWLPGCQGFVLGVLRFTAEVLGKRHWEKGTDVAPTWGRGTGVVTWHLHCGSHRWLLTVLCTWLHMLRMVRLPHEVAQTVTSGCIQSCFMLSQHVVLCYICCIKTALVDYIVASIKDILMICVVACDWLNPFLAEVRQIPVCGTYQLHSKTCLQTCLGVLCLVACC